MDKRYILPKKSDFKSIDISEICVNLPDLKNISESKSVVISDWLMGYIEKSLGEGDISVNNLLPSKSEFAYALGVSIGTMQNAFRRMEDLGYVESKQCIGTLIRDYRQPVTTMRKLTSKRDKAIEAIKKYIATSSYKVGHQLPSSRTIASIVGFSSNTTRMALENLCTLGIIEHKYKNSNEYGWILQNIDFEFSDSVDKHSKTLVDMVVKDLENYIDTNLNVGDRLPSHMVLSEKLKASIKTIHDAFKILNEKGIILSRRGRYGTTVVKKPSEQNYALKPETSIFAPAKDTAFYHYEKTQNRIKKMIANDYEVGDKLPSIEELSKEMDISPNTVRKAFHNLAKEGYLVFSRGRYGGTFVIDIPEVESATFKWLAVNPQFAKEYSQDLS